MLTGIPSAGATSIYAFKDGLSGAIALQDYDGTGVQRIALGKALVGLIRCNVEVMRLR